MSGPPEWAYERVGELQRAFTGDNPLPDLSAAYADLKGAFASFICLHEEAPVDTLAWVVAAALNHSVDRLGPFQADGSSQQVVSPVPASIPDAEEFRVYIAHSRESGE